MITAPDVDLLYPLSLFRRHNAAPVPNYEIVPADAVPDPYRKLLVHNGDMTSRLEAFHGGSIVLTVLHRERKNSAYLREVELRIEETDLPVEYGAIEIMLEALPSALQEKILEAHLPFGGLLNTFQVKYRSRPKAFIRLGADPFMSELFAVDQRHDFYGRCNEILGDDDRVLARIVEVLRP